MAGKPKLHYTDARGSMEPIRWLLAAAGEKFEEKFITSREDMQKIKNDESYMFQQVPMVEIDGMKLVQTRAILNYIADKHNLYGKDIKERALIDMYTEGIADLNQLVLQYPFLPPGEQEASLAQIKEKARNRYFSAFEKVLKSHGQDYLVGNRLSKADIHLVELIYNMEELDPNVIASFPLLQALKTRISSLPTVKKFLQPGIQRKPPLNEKSKEEILKIFMLHNEIVELAESVGQDESLMFQKGPKAEIDGMKLVQTRAILNCIANKYNFYGKDIQERALCSVFSVLTSADNAGVMCNYHKTFRQHRPGLSRKALNPMTSVPITQRRKVRQARGEEVEDRGRDYHDVATASEATGCMAHTGKEEVPPCSGLGFTCDSASEEREVYLAHSFGE
ncbi:glutathione S-transferase Yc-like [Lepus europaeus]|uniref:glutathione S-transferase Yc-like n=1 Tax=Lepus europaeus TaxID=9983 RepID=UPI002B4710C4|nr:glutathione S-transferase Yc-like [Lepus europaeus]